MGAGIGGGLGTATNGSSIGGGVGCGVGAASTKHIIDLAKVKLPLPEHITKSDVDGALIHSAPPTDP